MVAALGIPLFTALRLLREKPPWHGRRLPSWSPLAGGALFLVIYWYVLDRDPGGSRFLRYFQLSLALHLGVAIAPFLRHGETNGFWQFNRRLFLRAVLSSVYASVFFGGLALAILAVDRLFDAGLDSEIYPRLWLFTVFVFQTWHFLGGVPRDLAVLDGDRERPKGLEIFGRYLLVPLLVLYGLILYGYMVKVLLTRQWPHGWVGWMVSYAAIFGVLTLLLMDPGRDEPQGRWVKVFGRAYYAGILPLLGLLFAALGQRVGQYGVTERRYFLLVLGLWLGGVALYMLLGAAKSIKVVPVSLGLVALLTACGPWGAYQVSLRSQARRLESLLGRHGRLVDGRIAKSDAPVAAEDLKEIGEAVRYLVEAHGARVLGSWSDRDWAGLAPGASDYERPHLLCEEFLVEMGLEYRAPWRGAGNLIHFQSREELQDVAGYEGLLFTDFRASPAAGNRPWEHTARLGYGGESVEVLTGETVTLLIPLHPILDRLPATTLTEWERLPAEDLCVVAAGGSLRAKVCFTSIRIATRDTGARLVEGGSGYLLVGSAD